MLDTAEIRSNPGVVWVLIAGSWRARVYWWHNAADGVGDLHKLIPIPDGELEASTPIMWLHGKTRQEHKRRFLRLVARKLSEAHMAKAYDRLVIVAPARTIGDLHDQLPAVIQSKVEAVLPKDLTHLQGAELSAHLQDTLAEVQFA